MGRNFVLKNHYEAIFLHCDDELAKYIEVKVKVFWKGGFGWLRNTIIAHSFSSLHGANTGKTFSALRTQNNTNSFSCPFSIAYRCPVNRYLAKIKNIYISRSLLVWDIKIDLLYTCNSYQITYFSVLNMHPDQYTCITSDFLVCLSSDLSRLSILNGVCI